MKARSPLGRASHVVLIYTPVIVGLLVLASCDSADPIEDPGHGVEQIVISPSSALLEVGEQAQFSAVALNADGDPVDVSDLEIEWNWFSSDPSVFTVEAGGTATAQSEGEAYCIVEATILVGRSNFTGRDSANVMVF